MSRALLHDPARCTNCGSSFYTHTNALPICSILPLPPRGDRVNITNRASTDGKHLRYPENALRLTPTRIEAIAWENGNVTIDTGRTTLTLTPAQLRILDAARARQVIA